MSASDLAPFVAAIIDDGIAPELQRKNQKQTRKIDALESTLQDHDNERLLVQITGRQGHPIYGEKSLTEGRAVRMYHNGDDNLWFLDIQNEDEVGDNSNVLCICPFDKKSITELEIRVGGMLLMPRFLKELTVVTNFDYEEHEDEDDLDKLVYLDQLELELPTGRAFDDEDDCPINQLIGRVGPISVRYYKALCNLPEDDAIYISDLLEHNVLPTTGAATEAQPTRKMTLTVQAIEFYKNNISGCISLMKQLGIQTNELVW